MEANVIACNSFVCETGKNLFMWMHVWMQGVHKTKQILEIALFSWPLCILRCYADKLMNLWCRRRIINEEMNDELSRHRALCIILREERILAQSNHRSKRGQTDVGPGKPEATMSSSNRKFFVGGNWKMNGDKASIDALCRGAIQ